MNKESEIINNFSCVSPQLNNETRSERKRTLSNTSNTSDEIKCIKLSPTFESNETPIKRKSKSKSKGKKMPKQESLENEFFKRYKMLNILKKDDIMSFEIQDRGQTYNIYLSKASAEVTNNQKDETKSLIQGIFCPAIKKNLKENNKLCYRNFTSNYFNIKCSYFH